MYTETKMPEKATKVRIDKLNQMLIEPLKETLSASYVNVTRSQFLINNETGETANENFLVFCVDIKKIIGSETCSNQVCFNLTISGTWEDDSQSPNFNVIVWSKIKDPCGPIYQGSPVNLGDNPSIWKETVLNAISGFNTHETKLFV